MVKYKGGRSQTVTARNHVRTILPATLSNIAKPSLLIYMAILVALSRMPFISIMISIPSFKSCIVSFLKRNPEAGRAYWLTRTWDLLCWQPIYVALVSSTVFNRSRIWNIAQYLQPRFVRGFRLRIRNIFKVVTQY